MPEIFDKIDDQTKKLNDKGQLFINACQLLGQALAKDGDDPVLLEMGIHSHLCKMEKEIEMERMKRQIIKLQDKIDDIKAETERSEKREALWASISHEYHLDRKAKERKWRF
jgi:hypothetical protein